VGVRPEELPQLLVALAVEALVITRTVSKLLDALPSFVHGYDLIVGHLTLSHLSAHLAVFLLMLHDSLPKGMPKSVREPLTNLILIEAALLASLYPFVIYLDYDVL